MKKLVWIALALALLLSLTACGTKQAASQTAQGTGMANPWTDVASAAEAADGAGVGYFEVPEKGTQIGVGPVDIEAFRCMKGIAQANGYAGAAELMIRKGLKQDGEDVSGDYTNYAHQWTQEIDVWTVKCFGNEDGKAMKVIWCSDNFSYCIYVRGQGDVRDSFGLGADDVAALVNAIQ